MPFWKKTPPKDAVKTTVEEKADGSRTVTTSFTLSGTPRPVRDEVVEAFDAALAKVGDGSEVMHAIDPARLLSFENGGPPIWSVGMVHVAGPVPYTLLLTYGFSHTLSPEADREGVAHEYSLAIPDGVEISPWADALLRHQCRYILTQGNDIRVNDCVPFRGVSMTCIPYQPEHHAQMPKSSLVGIMAAPDPVLGRIATPAGEVEVRRLVGVDALELDRIETWDQPGFCAELQKANPLLLSPVQRPSYMSDPKFAAIVDARAAKEGSTVDAALFDLAWEMQDGALVVEMPRTPAGVTRLLNGLRGRLGFGRRLGAYSLRSKPISFEPGEPGIEVHEGYIQIFGDLEVGPIAAIVEALSSGTSAVRFT